MNGSLDFSSQAVSAAAAAIVTASRYPVRRLRRASLRMRYIAAG